MKRILTATILFIICFTNVVKAEENTYSCSSNIKSFVNESKLWHWLSWNQRSDTNDNRYFCLEGDTVINGILSKKMYLKHNEGNSRKIYYAALYEDGDKVYCCNDGYYDFRLLYDFGAEKGEVVTVGDLAYTVLDVEEILVDNEKLRVLYLSIVNNRIRDIVTWVQGFGCISYPSYLSPSFTAGYTYYYDFANCKIDGKIVLEAKDIPNPNLQAPLSLNLNWVGATWSYYDYDFEKFSFFRYTVLDRPEVIDGLTYYPLVKYTTCEYEEGKEEAVYRIRQEGQRIYMRKEDFADSTNLLGPIFQEAGNDYIFYDFSLKEGDEYCKLSYHTNLPPYSLKVFGVNEFQLKDNQYVKQLLFRSGVGDDTWIAGIGSLYDLMEPFTHPIVDCPCSRTLNYFCTADSCIIYRNPRTMHTNPYDKLYDEYDHFKEDDCALNPSKIGEVADVSPFIIQAIASTISCTSPTATKLEIYTMDAVKVGEATFANGEATVKVGKTPATYLYIVTYPNGRRESGKVAVK